MIRLNLRLFDGAPSGQAGSAVTGGSTTPSEGNSQKEGKVVYGLENNSQETTTDSGTEEESVEDKEAQRLETYNKFKADNKDLFQKDVDSVVNKRFKETRGLTERLDKLNPILTELAKKYDKDVNDTDGIVQAYMNDPQKYEEYAQREGLSIEQAQKMRELEMYREVQETANNRAAAESTYSDWMEQAEDLQELYPDFDLAEESENPDFIKVLQNGFGMQQAYELLHPEEHTKRLSREIASAQATNMTKRQQRPSENGIANGSTVERRSNVRNLTAEDRKKAIEQSFREGSGSVRFS